MKRIMIFLLVGLMLNLSIASAVSVGDHIYFIKGTGSDAYVWDGTVIIAGETRSKIDWDGCLTCDDWIYNSDMYYSKSRAQKVADKMDAEHTSAGEAAGGIAAGLLGLFIYGALCATDPKTGKPINEGCE